MSTNTTTRLTTIKADVMELFAQRLAKKEEERKKRENLFMELEGSTAAASGSAPLDYKTTVASKAKEIVLDFD
jgi:hypothetical protein